MSEKKSFKERRKERKLRKKQKRLWYKVRHREKKPPKVIYAIELFFVGILEFLRRVFKSIRYIIYFGLICAAVVLVAFVIPKYIEYNNQVDKIMADSSIEDFKINEGSIIYDCNGQVIANLYSTANNKYLSYEEIPEDVINAFVAVEDRTFWENSGIDIKGIIRVMWGYVKSSGAEVHGASTITQQLARNIYLTHEVSLDRKFKEMLIALRLTDAYSKEQILEFYINDICYANGICGIEGASKAYFNKEAKDLTLSQIAYLCAIPNSPEYYNPYKDSTTALERRDKILDDMYELNYISKRELKLAKEEKIVIEEPTYEFNDYLTTYAMDSSIRYLMKNDGFEFKYAFEGRDDYNKYQDEYRDTYERYKRRLYTNGYSIYTTLDKNKNAEFQAILDAQLENTNTHEEDGVVHCLQGALTIVDNKTRKVVGIVGGRTQDNGGVYSLNRAYQSYRQPGSTIKPLIVYTPALEYGYTTETSCQDINVTEAKKPDADPQKMYGQAMTLRRAVELSKNGVAWQIFDKITPKFGLSHIENMKFSGLCPDDYYNAAALGGFTYGVNTVEMAGAYATLANHGIYKEVDCLTSIKNSEGEEIYKEPEETRVYDAKASDDMVDVLKGVLVRGTATSLGWSRHSEVEAMCKTGTTNDNKDGWLCGSTPYYSIAVWIGYDKPRALSSLYGNSYPGLVWRDCMLNIINGKEVVKFERDEANYKVSTGQNRENTGYYSYLEGRDDSEVLSAGYTVADYRNDRVIGESVQDIVNQMNRLNRESADYDEKLEELHNKGVLIIDTIYSIKYTNEMNALLESTYNELKR